MMHFQYLIEDQSSAILIDLVMKKIIEDPLSVTYSCKAFKGIGGFTKKNTVKETKTGKLLNDLATYMRGFNKSLQGMKAALIVVLDNDDRDTVAFEKELRKVALKNNIMMDYVFCIAIEEVEAWLLGDENALQSAYPSAKINTLHTYIQDSICGTWEVLAEVVYPGGLAKLKKDCPTYIERGKCKCEWANSICQYMVISDNKSPSFVSFVSEIRKRM